MKKNFGKKFGWRREGKGSNLLAGKIYTPLTFLTLSTCDWIAIEYNPSAYLIPKEKYMQRRYILRGHTWKTSKRPSKSFSSQLHLDEGIFYTKVKILSFHTTDSIWRLLPMCVFVYLFHFQINWIEHNLLTLQAYTNGKLFQNTQAFRVPFQEWPMAINYQ